MMMNKYKKEITSDKIHGENIKENIHRYTKDAFIYWNKEESKIKLTVGLVNNIFKTTESSIELTIKEIKILLDDKSGILLDKIIYIADMIEPSRTYDGVEEIRQKVLENLDEGVLMGMDHTIKYLLSREQLIDLNTVKARNYLILNKA